MNPRFKPFVTPNPGTGADPRPFNLKVVAPTATDAPFRRLSTVLPATKPAAAGGDSSTDEVAEPKLETRKQGDKITRITVTCGCGRLHEIECEY